MCDEYEHWAPIKSKRDNKYSPIKVYENSKVYLNPASPLFRQANDFLIAISEPISSDARTHEYHITSYSLYKAISIGLEPQNIINVLQRLSSIILIPNFMIGIKMQSKRFGIKLVLKNNRYFLECPDPVILEKITKYKKILNVSCDHYSPEQKSYNQISECLIDQSETLKTLDLEKYNEKLLVKPNVTYRNFDFFENNFWRISSIESREKTEKRSIFIVEVDPDKVENIKKSCRDIYHPLLEEYDFRSDHKAPSLDIRLKTEINLMPSQKKSLSRIFGKDSARSGIIVLPKNAGKTVVGVSAACTLRKSTIVFAATEDLCRHWKSQFLKLTDFSEMETVPVYIYTASTKETFPKNEPCIVITTYSMIAFIGKRSKESKRIMAEIKKRVWGLAILDDMHSASEETLRKCLNAIKSKCKLGLAEYLDCLNKKTKDLSLLIGPKLYQANRKSLSNVVITNRPEYIEILCPMNPLFYSSYLEETSANRRNLLKAMNPAKIRNCENLIKYHEKMGHKIIVFSDNIYSLKKYAELLERPFVDCENEKTRMQALDALQHDIDTTTIFVSKVDKYMIDLLEVNVMIRISSRFSSKQEKQRLFWIVTLKQKRNYESHFYTLISEETDETVCAFKRQNLLVDKGYFINVLKSFVGSSDPSFKLSDTKSVEELLKEVMDTPEKNGEIELDTEELPESKQQEKKNESKEAKKIKYGNMDDF